MLPGRLLILNGLQALRRSLAVVRGLDRLARQGVVGTRRDGSRQESVCLDDQVVVGLRLGKRCLDGEIRKDEIGPARQRSGIYGLSVLFPKLIQTLSGGADELVLGRFLLAGLDDLDPD